MANKLITGLAALVGIPLLAGAVGLYSNEAGVIGSFTNEAQGCPAIPACYENRATRVRCENNKYHILVPNPDGSVSQSTLIYSPTGEFLGRCVRPYPDKRIDKKPRFQSIAPILTYPDETIEGYRPLREGESLWDVLKECPVDRYVPKNLQKNNNFEDKSTGPLLDSEDRGCPLHRYVPKNSKKNDSETKSGSEKPKVDNDGWQPAKD